jgi:hypothetical protein
MGGRVAPSEEAQHHPRPQRVRGEEPRGPLHTAHGRDGLPGPDVGEEREEAKAPKRRRQGEEAGAQAGQPCVWGSRLGGGGHGPVDDGRDGSRSNSARAGRP